MVFHKPVQAWVGRLVNYQKSWDVKHRLLVWVMLFIYLDKHYFFQWKKVGKDIERLGDVLQWLCWPGLHTGQLYLIFVTLTAKHWLPFYFFRSTCATFMLSLWPVTRKLRYLCCQFFSHHSFLELLHALEQHSVLIAWITVSLAYCRTSILSYPFHPLLRVIPVLFLLCLLSSAQGMPFLRCWAKPQPCTPLKLPWRSTSVMLARN